VFWPVGCVHRPVSPDQKTDVVAHRESGHQRPGGRSRGIRCEAAV
jgi:hypothetical protein